MLVLQENHQLEGSDKRVTTFRNVNNVHRVQFTKNVWLFLMNTVFAQNIICSFPCLLKCGGTEWCEASWVYMKIFGRFKDIARDGTKKQTGLFWKHPELRLRLRFYTIFVTFGTSMNHFCQYGPYREIFRRVGAIKGDEVGRHIRCGYIHGVLQYMEQWPEERLF